MSKTANEGQLPYWRCHKLVQAVHIKSIKFNEAGAEIEPREEGVGVVQASPGFSSKFKPRGEDLGVYVRYKDGYDSWSPTQAFDDSYDMAPGFFDPLKPGEPYSAYRALKIYSEHYEQCTSADVPEEGNDCGIVLFFGEGGNGVNVVKNVSGKTGVNTSMHWFDVVEELRKGNDSILA